MCDKLLDCTFNKLLNTLTVKHLCCILEMIEILETSLLMDKHKNQDQTQKSIETISASKQLFETISQHLNVSIYIGDELNQPIDKCIDQLEPHSPGHPGRSM